jgi:GMP synthase-like glutamine amidotransferase
VQFHPEVRRDQVLRWFEEDETVMRTIDALTDELNQKLPSWQEHGRALCRAFLAAARS